METSFRTKGARRVFSFWYETSTTPEVLHTKLAFSGIRSSKRLSAHLTANAGILHRRLSGQVGNS